MRDWGRLGSGIVLFALCVAAMTGPSLIFDGWIDPLTKGLMHIAGLDSVSTPIHHPSGSLAIPRGWTK